MTHPAGFFRLCVLWLLSVAPVAAAPWVTIASDQLPDPAVHYGTLTNGLRYAIRPNTEPKGRVSLRLLVSAGSLVERDDERGLAHFVEHMAFRGTQAYPGNSLTTALERRSIGLGPDNTAFTSYDYTVYHLELPDGQPETLRLGLEVFREYAAGLTFDRDAIEKERGVIISEKDTRNTPDERFSAANLSFLWSESRQARRAPIGLEQSVQQFTREQFVAFYDAWYRPERMAVIIVGNIGTEQAEKLVTEILGPLAARAPPRDEPTDMVPEKADVPNVAMYTDTGLLGVRFFFSHPKPRPVQPDTHALRVAALHRGLAFAMFAKRLDWATRRRGGSIVAPTVTTENYIHGWEAVAFSASGRFEDWSRLAANLEQEHRRAYLLGFTEDELRLAKIQFANNYEEAVRSEATRHSAMYAAQIGSLLLYGGVLTTPAAAQRDLAADLQAATLADCARAFRSAWTHAPPHVVVAANQAFNVTRAEIGRVLNESRQEKVSLPPPAKPVTFAYTSFGKPGRLTHDDYVADLDLHLGKFANGVRLNFKSTPFAADTVDMIVRVGTGRLSQPENEPGLELLASYGFLNGGVGRHSSEEFDSLLSSHLLGIQFGVESDACAFYVRCARRDLFLALQVVTAFMTDPAYRPEALAGVHASLGTFYSSLAAAPSGMFTLRAERYLTGFNRRVGLPEFTEAYARSFKELAQWLDPEFKSGAIELSVIGDTTWDEASSAVASTLGALQKRDRYPRPGKNARIRFAQPSVFPILYPLNLDQQQAAIAWYWPVPDLSGVHQERRSRLLAAVLTELLFTRLREELGATYTPSADFVQYDGLPAFSYFTLRADVTYAQGPKAAQIIRREIEHLVAKGIDEDVFVRAKQPFLRLREEDLRKNSYWGHTVLRDAQLRPERLDAARDRTADTAAITRRDLEALARRYLDPARGFLFVAEPGATSTWGGKYFWDSK